MKGIRRSALAQLLHFLHFVSLVYLYHSAWSPLEREAEKTNHHQQPARDHNPMRPLQRLKDYIREGHSSVQKWLSGIGPGRGLKPGPSSDRNAAGRRAPDPSKGSAAGKVPNAISDVCRHLLVGRSNLITAVVLLKPRQIGIIDFRYNDTGRTVP